nr:hypothetical protein BaRGS_007558 [Batillaria attramentaria]
MWGKRDDLTFDLATSKMPFPKIFRDEGIQSLEKHVPVMFVLSFIVSVFHMTKSVVYEKERKLKEAMKLMGLMPSAYWASWFLTFYVYLAVVMAAYTAVLVTELFEVPLFRNVDVSLVFLFLLCYAAAIMSFGIMMSTFFDKACGALSQFKKLGKDGVQWTNYHIPVYPDSVCLRDIMAMLVLDTCLHLLVTCPYFFFLTVSLVYGSPYYYFLTVSLVYGSPYFFFLTVSLVYGSPYYFFLTVSLVYGSPYYFLMVILVCGSPHYFFLSKKYWCQTNSPKKLHYVDEEEAIKADDQQFFEREPKHLKAGIKIRTLRKVFDNKKVAVHDLTLNMYEGHISVLLGHNGAGKTTTMFMLTGRSRVREEVELMIKETGLEHKRRAYADTLSGGQKRRLSIGIALVNGSKVVILDEPTSGVDPSARRQIWDLLLRHRKGRTLVLSTHFMDEADALGNRIAIMSKGKLVCCGTSMFLKKLCGTGYHLTIVKAEGCQKLGVVRVIKSHVHKAKAGEESKSELHFLLPNNQVSKFPALFRQLEAQKEELGILCFGASASTMEDVFLRMGRSTDDAEESSEDLSEATAVRKLSQKRQSMVHGSQSYVSLVESSSGVDLRPGRLYQKRANSKSTDDTDVASSKPEYVKLTGVGLQVTRMRAILVKKLIHLWRNRVLAVVQLLLPVLFVFFALLSKAGEQTFRLDPVVFDMRDYTPSVITYMAARGPVMAMYMCYGNAFMLTLFVHFLVKEQSVGAKHMQGNLLSVVTLVLVAYGWAILPFIYLSQFLFKTPATGTLMSIVYNIVTGGFLSFGMNSCIMVVYKIFTYKYRLPSWATDKIDRVDVLAAIFHPSDWLVDDCEKNICFAVRPTDDPWDWEIPGVGRYVACMLAQGAVFTVLTLLVETDLGRVVTTFLADPASVVRPAVPLEQDMASTVEDSDVAAERNRINSTPIPELTKHDSLILFNLYKQFGDFAAVRKVCVGVPEKECFGLLGQNGAGKTTIFKMLTGDVMMTDGTAYVKGHDIRHELKTVQSNLGYCPQFDALHDQMTARETLTMYARLRGVPETYISGAVNKLLDLLRIQPIADNESRTYSGGNKRKLSMAMTLVGDPHFVLLDEPSSGLDAGAKRVLWGALTLARASGHTLVLTSHSMEECEAMCTRLAIMVNGGFVCLGSTQHLKHKFGQGYTLIAKMNDAPDGTPMSHEPFTAFVKEKFPCATVFDVHEGYVHLQVTDPNVHIADLFEQMQIATGRLPVQYYIVQQTTLEQVFLSFTRQQVRPMPPQTCYHSCCCCLIKPEDVQRKRSEALRD